MLYFVAAICLFINNSLKYEISLHIYIEIRNIFMMVASCIVCLMEWLQGQEGVSPDHLRPVV